MPRLMLSNKDVQLITGKGRSAASALIIKIKQEFNIARYAPLPVKAFCDYTGLDLELVLAQLR